MSHINISIIILSHNRLTDLKSNLHGIFKDRREDIEVIVVDNASSDGSREFLVEISREYSALTIILNNQNTGVAIGRNAGFKIAKGHFVVSLDDDASMAMVDIARVPGLFEQFPNAGILAFKVCHSVTGDLQNDNGDRVIPLANFHGAGHAIRKQVFDKTGYLDELCTFGAEELDFSIRAHAVGYETIYIPSIIVHHNSFIRPGKLGVERLITWTYNFTRVFFKHFCFRIALLLSFRNTFNFIKYAFTKYGGKDGLLIAFKLSFASIRGVVSGLENHKRVPDHTLSFYDNPELRPYYGNNPLKLFNKLNRKILNCTSRYMSAAGITGFMPGPFILMYHSIDDNGDDPYAVSVGNFRRQMAWLAQHGFEVVSLSFLLRSIKDCNYRVLRNKVVITFDDGYSDFVTNALPILLNHKATATVFLVTDLLGGKASWNDAGQHLRLMSEDEARYIKTQGMSLGSHTATHTKLTLLDQDELKRQLEDSRNVITSLGESFRAFAYPWGQWTSLVAEAVKASGFDCALAVGEGTRFTAADAYFLPRVTIRSDTDLNRFQALLSRTSVEIEIRRKYRFMRETTVEALAKKNLFIK
jgi:GT2 family glycosyltransferase/peptidoglycan/xylan/chitin deacetylase (PgdA/CDA1 family)